MKGIFQLVGMKHRPPEAQEIVKGLKGGDQIVLKREPSNQYDRFAIQVHAGAVHIGFLKSTENQKQLARAMDGAKRDVLTAKFVAGEWPSVEVDESLV